MQIVKFTKEHINDLCLLSELRNHPIKIDQIPAEGFIVFEYGIPVAAGFIRKIEACDFGMVDGFITRPDMHREIRKEALELLSTTIINHAKSLHINKLIAFSTHENTILWACSNGFTLLDNRLIGITL